MLSKILPEESLTHETFSMKNLLYQQIGRLVGLCLGGILVFCFAALSTWNTEDPSFNHATGNAPTNFAGHKGAILADLMMQFYGLACIPLLLPILVWAYALITKGQINKAGRRALAWLFSSLLFSATAACLPTPSGWPLPAGLGGIIGDIVIQPFEALQGGLSAPSQSILKALFFLVPGLYLFAFGSGMRFPWRRTGIPDAATAEYDSAFFAPERSPLFSSAWLGHVAHLWLFIKALLGRKIKKSDSSEKGDVQSFPMQARGSFSDRRHRRIEPEFSLQKGARDTHHDQEANNSIDDIESDMETPLPPMGTLMKSFFPNLYGKNTEKPLSPGQAQKQSHYRTSEYSDTTAKIQKPFDLPLANFLSEAKITARDPSLSKEALQKNAHILESILEDFGVKGEIIHAKAGPVVTLYELEPAPGIKSSRVIGLADDIARSMSAVACRVAVIAGRNAIGIELPNKKREKVYLRELLASRDFKQAQSGLPLALGKTINGDSVVVDITRMPHVLVAGTTGSGKSVAINTMILSILYKLTPEECRFIMIDPKMLELSVYEGIPHLLAPVVTEPQKAVAALKWAVREMEERYRKMSKLGVRNIDGFNARIMQAEKKGEHMSRTVQTGFHKETGEAIYETETFELKKMPYIIVIIDEMADLMMVAGKDIESAVQRLAQMARAAGIHVIMATQRPSVDVITGTIKANFPTRISFQVTSKIDSRTILGEQGGEQLLGMGDMLYMAGGGRIQRVHGPFVSDAEVEKIVRHLKLQGSPEYLEAITCEEPDEKKNDKEAGFNESMADSEDPYTLAIEIILRDGKASTSYIQRRLGIGYNRAASIIERMESEGIIGKPNHAGKREILIKTEENRI